MADKPKKRGKADRQRIATAQPHELKRWAKKLGVPRWVLVMAHDALFSWGQANTVRNFEEYIAMCKETATDTMRRAAKQ